jgi:hypothetical protein
MNARQSVIESHTRKSGGRVVLRAAVAVLVFGAGCTVRGLEEGELGSIQQPVTGVYLLKAVHSGKCVEVADGDLTNGANVQQWTCNGGMNQQWEITDCGGGIHLLKAVHSGRFMNVYNGATPPTGSDNGANVQQYGNAYTCATTSGNVKFKFTDLGSGSGQYQLQAQHSLKCVDVNGGSGATGDGVNITQWSCSGTATNQRFTLQPVGSSPPLGSGWVQYSPTKKIHLDDDTGLQTFNWTSQKSVCSPTPCADYQYDSSTDTETFRILDTRSNRAEIRLQNDYDTGSRQFQGYVTFDAPLNDESLFQIWGSTSGATQLMIRGYSANNGEIRGNGTTLSSGCYGVERRVNVIHRQGQDIRMYINGSLTHTIVDDEVVSNYHKYGCYGSLTTAGATVKWRAARFYTDGQPPN